MAKKLVEPTSLDELNVIEMARVIGNYREQNISYDKLKNWVIAAGNKMNISESELISDLPDNWFIDTWGYVARLYLLGLLNLPSNLSKLNIAIVDMVSKTKSLKSQTTTKISPMNIVKDQVEDFYDTIKSNLDNPNLNIINAVMAMDFSNVHIKQLINLLPDCKSKEELELHLEKNITKRNRKKKTKSKEDQCKLFKYMKTFDGIEGYEPENIVGSNCVVVYHTQKKTITFYIGKKLGVNRSMIIGFDEEQSGEYKLKNKEDLVCKGKVRINGVLQSYEKEVKSIPTGRVSDKMIIIGVY